MDKLTMAHEHAQGLLSKKKTEFYVLKDVVAEAWRYVELMQAEADKREEEKNKEILKILNTGTPSPLIPYEYEDAIKTQQNITATAQYRPFTGNGYIDPLKTDDKTCKHELRDLGKYRTCMVCDYIEEVEND